MKPLGKGKMVFTLMKKDDSQIKEEFQQKTWQRERSQEQVRTDNLIWLDPEL